MISFIVEKNKSCSFFFEFWVNVLTKANLKQVRIHLLCHKFKGGSLGLISQQSDFVQYPIIIFHSLPATVIKRVIKKLLHAHGRASLKHSKCTPCLKLRFCVFALFKILVQFLRTVK